MAFFFGGVQRATQGIWKVGIDGIGNEVQTLDLTVYVHHDYDCNSLRWRPYAKPTGQRIPLQPQSAHSPTVHRSWPLAELARIANNSVKEREFKEAAAAFINKAAKNL